MIPVHVLYHILQYQSIGVNKELSQMAVCDYQKTKKQWVAQTESLIHKIMSHVVHNEHYKFTCSIFFSMDSHISIVSEPRHMEVTCNVHTQALQRSIRYHSRDTRYHANVIYEALSFIAEVKKVMQCSVRSIECYCLFTQFDNVDVLLDDLRKCGYPMVIDNVNKMTLSARYSFKSSLIIQRPGIPTTSQVLVE